MNQSEYFRSELARVKRDRDVAVQKLGDVKNAITDAEGRIAAGQKPRVEDLRHLSNLDDSLTADIAGLDVRITTLTARLKDAIAAEQAELNRLAAELENAAAKS